MQPKTRENKTRHLQKALQPRSPRASPTVSTRQGEAERRPRAVLGRLGGRRLPTHVHPPATLCRRCGLPWPFSHVPAGRGRIARASGLPTGAQEAVEGQSRTRRAAGIPETGASH